MAEDTIYGQCPVCGSKGTDYPAVDLTSADSQSNIDGDASTLTDPSKGVVLVRYLGRLMCEVCKNRLMADEESLLSAKKHVDAQTFRDKVGFKRSV